MNSSRLSIAITGGTGSFGSKLLSSISQTSKYHDIVVLSRDEKKQHDMRVSGKYPEVRFRLCDVRDFNRVRQCLKGIDYVFHASALKHVPSCEYDPYEAVNTNIVGSQNVYTAAIDVGVKKVVSLSTDKAVYPVNAMGISKAMMEKLSNSFCSSSSETTFCTVRYGNVLCSRGSVIPLFLEKIAKGEPLTVTDPKMTRFLLSLADAIDLANFALERGKGGDLYVRKSSSASISCIVESLKSIFPSLSIKTKVIGCREAEKIHEVLVSDEEAKVSIDHELYYQIPSRSNSSYESFYTQGGKVLESGLERAYSSDNTSQLSVDELATLLRCNHEFKSLCKFYSLPIEEV